VRQSTVEIVGITGPKQPGLPRHGQFQFPLDDDPPFFARMREQVFAGIGIRLVGLRQDRHLAVTPRGRHQAILDRAGADVRQFRGTKHHGFLRFHVAGEKLGHGHRKGSQDLLQRTDRGADPVLLDQ